MRLYLDHPVVRAAQRRQRHRSRAEATKRDVRSSRICRAAKDRNFRRRKSLRTGLEEKVLFELHLETRRRAAHGAEIATVFVVGDAPGAGTEAA